MKTTLLSIAAIFLTGSLLAQGAVNVQLNEMALRSVTDQGNMSSALVFDQRYEGVRGTPLLFENWQEGTLKILGKEEAISPVKLNLNFHQHIAAVCYQNGAVSVLPNAKIEFMAFEVDGETQRFVPMPAEQVEGAKKQELRFYQALHQGEKFTLLKAHIRQFKKADYQGAYAGNIRYDEYVPDEAYFLRKDDEEFVKIRLRKPIIEKQLASWKVKVPASASSADLNTAAGVVQVLEALEKE